ncbi:MAG: quercetin 2,3-dioxygenase [Legionella sp. 40-6]|nr:pirin family protein [Legionella sp.]OJY46281.1 MAG: quercetin 2,3-dioxygenase [Legionella sp. 40-6]
MGQMQVKKILNGMLVREGAGVKLHRYIGQQHTDELEPLLLLDFFNSSDPLDFMAGFPSHPHRGFETITYLFSGSIQHKDNHGHQGTIGPGDVQWMTAGKGIIHSEMPDATQKPLKGLQLWLNLPAAAKMSPPKYQELAHEQLPLEHDGGVKVKVIAGTTAKGTNSPIHGIATQPLFFDVQLEAGVIWTQPIPDDYQTILLLVRGEVMISGESVSELQLAVLDEQSSLTVVATQASQFILIAAKKIHEPIVRHGPFVMNTAEEIRQAMIDFQQGLF